VLLKLDDVPGVWKTSYRKECMAKYNVENYFDHRELGPARLVPGMRMLSCIDKLFPGRPAEAGYPKSCQIIWKRIITK